jgi:hypothetical protein
MPNIEARTQLSPDELLNGVAQLATPDLETFISDVLILRAKRAAPNLGHEEARLLQLISKRLPPETQQRYDELTEKRRAETMTSEEHQELLGVNDDIERADAERTGALIELAQLRGVSVQSLKTDLGIRAADYA